MPKFSFPDEKLRRTLGPIIKKEIEKARYNKGTDPFYQEHLKKIEKIVSAKPLWLSR